MKVALMVLSWVDGCARLAVECSGYDFALPHPGDRGGGDDGLIGAALGTAYVETGIRGGLIGGATGSGTIG